MSFILSVPVQHCLAFKKHIFVPLQEGTKSPDEMQNTGEPTLKGTNFKVQNLFLTSNVCKYIFNHSLHTFLDLHITVYMQTSSLWAAVLEISRWNINIRSDAVGHF